MTSPHLQLYYAKRSGNVKQYIADDLSSLTDWNNELVGRIRVYRIALMAEKRTKENDDLLKRLRSLEVLAINNQITDKEDQ